MHFAIRVLLVFGVAAFLLPESGKASVVFKPGKKPEYVGPGGEEELSGDAVDLFQIGQAADVTAGGNPDSLGPIRDLSLRRCDRRRLRCVGCRSRCRRVDPHPRRASRA